MKQPSQVFHPQGMEGLMKAQDYAIPPAFL
jgi:hypothetical protein